MHIRQVINSQLKNELKNYKISTIKQNITGQSEELFITNDAGKIEMLTKIEWDDLCFKREGRRWGNNSIGEGVPRAYDSGWEKEFPGIIFNKRDR